MTITSRLAAAVAALALAALPAPATAGAQAPDRQEHARHQQRDPELLALMDEILEAMLERFPVWLGPRLGDDRYNDQLTDESPEAHEAWNRRNAEWLQRVRDLDRAGFAEEDHLDADLLEYRLALGVEAAPLHREQMPVSSIGGPQYWLPQLPTFVPFTRPRHYEDYLRRLEAIPIHVGQQIEQMRRGIEAGRVPPRVTIEPAVRQALDQASPEYLEDPRLSPFYEPFRNHADDDPLAARARRIIREDIVPLYTELAVFLQNEYLPACRDSIGIAEGVDGVAAYELAIREHTTLELTADQVHQTGLDEVARIRAEMIDVIRGTDWYTDGPGADFASDDPDNRSADTEADMFDAFVDYLRTDERFYYDDPEDLLAGYRNISKLMDAEMPRLFRRLPRLPYGVRAIPRFAARSSPTAYYYHGNIETGRAGLFMANTYALDQRPKFDMVALTLHEAVPGHHHQIAIAQELEDAHPLRRVTSYTAFVEGWALYAERLGLEVGDDPDRGLYADPYDDFGRLNYEMWRAMRLVVDTGMHTRGWSRDKAIEYMLANGAGTRVDTENEIDRYIGWPGQALAYKIGELRIRALRERAETELGDRFDLRDFHDTLLEAGALPLPVLEARMRRWIDAQR